MLADAGQDVFGDSIYLSKLENLSPYLIKSAMNKIGILYTELFLVVVKYNYNFTNLPL